MTTDPQRSATMRAVKSRDTEPEMIVRRALHSMGYRFRIHRRDLPGTPDIALPGRRKVIFVHGCFWHGHECARGARVPQNNREHWTEKIRRNRTRDARAESELIAAGWQVLCIWECETKNLTILASKLKLYCDPPDPDRNMNDLILRTPLH
jgi:DNA mismatch endonuclease, patch repair protein